MRLMGRAGWGFCIGWSNIVSSQQTEQNCTLEKIWIHHMLVVSRMLLTSDVC